MNKVLKILTFAVILFLAYMWVSILYKSCNKSSEFDAFEGDNVELNEEVPSLSEDIEDDPFFEDEETDDPESTTTAIDYDELDQKIEETQNTRVSNPVRETKTVNDQRTPVSSDASGRYMVIAGSYILENNADEMVQKLKAQGYPDAEKVVFDLSQFFSVCAGRFDDYTKAVQQSSELKRRGIDSYVHRRK